jgi:hypothetical protein
MSLDPTDKLDKSAFSATPHDAVPEKTLIWHKVEAVGFKPAAREGATSVATSEAVVYVFGGVEAGTKVNSTYSLDITTSTWRAREERDDDTTPCPRTYHAACMIDSIMLIHGGEGDAVKRAGAYSGAEARKEEKVEGEMTPRLAEKRTGGVLEGDLLGATIGATQSSSSGKTTVLSPNLEATISLDDLYGFNTRTGVWRKLVCGLAPLPRKGHTMSVGMVCLGSTSTSGLTECVLMFGGHCRETETYSNAVLVCPVEDLVATFFGASSSSSKINRACTWRTLATRGPQPMARYSHSATVLQSGWRTYLCVFGGLNKHGGALNDVQLLDLESLVWRSLERRTESGDWPFPVFGHTAFAVPGDSERVGFASDNQLLVIFGGEGGASRGSKNGNVGREEEEEEEEKSNDPNEASSRGCRNALVVCDINTGVWRRLTGSLGAPSARVSHCAAVCSNFTLRHPLPQPLKSGQPRPSPAAMLAMMATTNNATRGMGGVAVIFGGRAEASYPSDCWALDFTWRLAGVDGYDGSLAERLRVGMMTGVGMGIGGGTATAMSHSSSMPTLATTNTLDVGTFGDSNSFGTAFHRVRRERALADVQLVKERERADAAEAVCATLRQELAAAATLLTTTEASKEDECRQLRQAIEESNRRERKLVALLEEAQKLLLLSGIAALTQE